MDPGVIHVNELARRPSANHRATAKRGSPTCSAEQRETVRRGLRRRSRRRARTPTERLTGTIVAASAPALITPADPTGILCTFVAETVL